MHNFFSRLVNAYNKTLELDPNVSESSINIFSNNCPSMLEPLKKISITRLLQVKTVFTNKLILYFKIMHYLN